MVSMVKVLQGCLERAFIESYHIIKINTVAQLNRFLRGTLRSGCGHEPVSISFLAALK